MSFVVVFFGCVVWGPCIFFFLLLLVVAARARVVKFVVLLTLTFLFLLFL